MTSAALLLAAAFGGASGFTVQTPTAATEVAGTVWSAGSGQRQPLPFATVELVLGDARRTVSADAVGRYRFPAVRGGSAVLRASHVGYGARELTVLVPVDGRISVDLELVADPVPMAPMRVRGVRDAGVPAPDSTGAVRRAGAGGDSSAEIDLRALEIGSGMAGAGLGDAARGGVGNDPPDPSDVLFMRGATTDLKLVLIDGAPVFTPFHVGGLMPTFDPGLVADASLFIGGAPAEYDGGLSYILDVSTRRPGGARPRDGVLVNGLARVDMLGAAATVDSRFGSRFGGWASGRALHGAEHALLGRDPTPYGYADAIARSDLELAPDVTLSMTGFWNRESVRLSYSRPEIALLGDAAPSEAVWGNRAVSAGVTSRAGDTDVDVRVAWGDYQARLPLDETAPVFASGATRRGRATVDASVPWREGAVSFGAALERMRVEYGLSDARSLQSDLAPDRRSLGAATSVAAYAEGARTIAGEVRVRAGVRVTGYTDHGARLAPRLGVTWALSDAAALTFSAGRYHQLTQVPVDAPTADVASGQGDALTPGPAVRGSPLTVAGATHLVVGLDQRFDRRTRLGLEAFHKRFDGLPGAGGGDLNASGVDVRVRRDGDRVGGWLGYSLNWFWSDSATDTPFSGRHLLSAGLHGRVAGPFGFEARLAYGDGLPFTAVPVSLEGAAADEAVRRIAPDPFLSATQTATGDAPFPAGPTGDFLRLDGSLFASFEQGWGGRSVGLRPYLKVLNALDRRDALFYYFDRWRSDGPRPLAELTLLPVVGIEIRF